MTRGESPSRLPHFSIRFASLQLWEQLLYISSRASTSHTFPFRLMQTSILFKRLYDIPREAHLLETRSKRSSCVCSMFCKNVAEPNSKPENNIATAASHHLMPSFSPPLTASKQRQCGMVAPSQISDLHAAVSRLRALIARHWSDSERTGQQTDSIPAKPSRCSGMGLGAGPLIELKREIPCAKQTARIPAALSWLAGNVAPPGAASASQLRKLERQIFLRQRSLITPVSRTKVMTPDELQTNPKFRDLWIDIGVTWDPVRGLSVSDSER
jgi:hypothetical protein